MAALIAALGLALASGQPARSWTCEVAFLLEGDRGTLSRRVDRRGRPATSVAMNLWRDGWDQWRSISWDILPADALVPPPASAYRTKSRRTVRSETVPRPAATAFDEGPSGAPFYFRWNRRRETGALWIHYYGDGATAGREQIANAQLVRRDYHLFDGIGWTLKDRLTLARLARARQLTAVLTNEAGQELARDGILNPAPAEARQAFERAFAELRRAEADYRKSCKDNSAGVVVTGY